MGGRSHDVFCALCQGEWSPMSFDTCPGCEDREAADAGPRYCGAHDRHFTPPDICPICKASGKADVGKLRWSLLPWAAVREVTRVMEYGAAKYSANSWQGVSPERYQDALLRHVVAAMGGDARDSETGLHHWSHAACNALFLTWFALRDEA